VQLSKLLGGIPVAKILQNPALQVGCIVLFTSVVHAPEAG
jgi:hypothetical protein